MNMKMDVSVYTERISGFFGRFHTLLFFLAVSTGLVAAILVLVSIINSSDHMSSSSANNINGTFDEETIKRIDNLGDKTLTKPGKRPSPFTE